MTTNAGLGSEPEHVLTIDRMLDIPVEKLWRCWTEPGLFQQWFCPWPWYVTDVRMDLRPGGEFHSVFNGPDGELIENAGVFLEVEPLRRLVSTDGPAAAWRRRARKRSARCAGFAAAPIVYQAPRAGLDTGGEDRLATLAFGLPAFTCLRGVRSVTAFDGFDATGESVVDDNALSRSPIWRG